MVDTRRAVTDAPRDASTARNDVSRNVILIGASTGGIQAVGKVLGQLPPNFRAAIAVTLHRGPTPHSMLAKILSARSKLSVGEARHGEPFASGRVYLAPPDHHLTFNNGILLLDRGPRQNHVRPSIDVMFRSGAKTFGPRVVGVILTGNLTDGVAGLKVIKSHGGLSIAQEPSEALAPSMPLHAVVYDSVDIVFQLAAGGEVLKKLADAAGVNAALAIQGTRRPSDAP